MQLASARAACEVRMRAHRHLSMHACMPACWPGASWRHDYLPVQQPWAVGSPRRALYMFATSSLLAHPAVPHANQLCRCGVHTPAAAACQPAFVTLGEARHRLRLLQLLLGREQVRGRGPGASHSSPALPCRAAVARMTPSVTQLAKIAPEPPLPSQLTARRCAHMACQAAPHRCPCCPPFPARWAAAVMAPGSLPRQLVR